MPAGHHVSALRRLDREPVKVVSPEWGRSEAENLGVLGMSTEQRGETCSRSSPLGVLTEETHHQRDKGAEPVRPARGRPVEVY
jgi:hypothetical protein